MSIALLQHPNGSIPTPGANSISVNFAPVTVGNLLVAIFSQGAVAGFTGAISDTMGNVWSPRFNVGSIDSTLVIVCWVTIAKASGVTTVTINGGAGTAICQLQLAEFSQIANPPSDGDNGRFGAAASPFSTNAVVTTQPGDLIVAGVALPADAITDWATDHGFTVQDTINVSIGGGMFQSFAWAFLIAGASGSYSTDFSTAQIVHSTEEVAGLSAFFAGQAAPPPTPPNSIITVFRNIFLADICCRREICWPIATQKVWYLDRA